MLSACSIKALIGFDLMHNRKVIQTQPSSYMTIVIKKNTEFMLQCFLDLPVTRAKQTIFCGLQMKTIYLLLCI